MRSILAAILVVCASLALAQSLEIIELRNRPAEQVIPIVQPMLDRGGVITGTGFQLMVRTSPANLAQIRQMVATIDRPARQLVIQVRQDSDTRDSRFDARGAVVVSPGNTRAAGTFGEGSTSGSSNISQQVRTQEGSAAFIRTGTSQVLPSRTVTRTVNGVVMQETVTERNLNSGFYATPRVSGDTVFLDISTQRETPSRAVPGAAAVSSASTTVSGRLGEWIEVGGATQSRSFEGSGVLARSAESASLSQRIYLRVEEVR
jgi:type II secretory pathway component GspD/PulD (secretin)